MPSVSRTGESFRCLAWTFKFPKRGDLEINHIN